MAVMKDVLVVLHSVVVMLAVQYILQDHKLIECQTKHCSYEDKRSSSSPWSAMLSMKTDIHSEGSVIQCSCCKLTSRRLVFAIFTVQAIIHLFISIITVLLKHRVISLSKFSWVYLLIIITTLGNAFFITRLFSFSNARSDIVDGGERIALWKLLTSPLNFVWRTITYFICVAWSKLFIEPLGLSNWMGQNNNSVKTSLYLCSLSDDLELQNSEYGLAVLSWIYVISSVFNVQILVTSMHKEKLLKYEIQKLEEQRKYVNNNCITNCGNPKRPSIVNDDAGTLDCSSDDDASFVSGWRL